MDDDNKWLIGTALIIAGGITYAAWDVVSRDSSSWQEVISAHWPLLLGTSMGVFVALFSIFMLMSWLGEMAGNVLDGLFSLLTPLRFVVLLAFAGAAYFYYQSMPQTRAECVASEMRKMGQGTKTAAIVAITICKDKGF